MKIKPIADNYSPCPATREITKITLAHKLSKTEIRISNELQY